MSSFCCTQLKALIPSLGSTLLRELAEGPRSRPLQKSIKLHVAANVGGEVVTVCLTQRSDAGRAVLLADLTIVIPAPLIKARAAIL